MFYCALSDACQNLPESEVSRIRPFLIYLSGSVNLAHKLLSWQRPAHNGVMELDGKLIIRVGLQDELLANIECLVLAC